MTLPLRQVGSQVGRLGQVATALDVNGAAQEYIVESVTASGPTYTLLAAASATGAVVGPIVGGTYIWMVAGTFGGTTVKLQALGPDGATYIDVPSASLSAVGAVQVVIGAGAMVKAVVTGGAPSGLYSSLT